MPILTLTTDWGERDHYVSAFKGEIFGALPGIQVVDLSHGITKFNTMEAAFILKNSYSKFPTGTIHFIGLTGSELPDIEEPWVAIKNHGHYFVGFDSGIFTLIFDENPQEIIRLPIHRDHTRSELHTILLSKIQAIINGEFARLGKSDTKTFEQYFPRPTSNQDSLFGSIIYIDSFGNAISNISKDFFEQIRGSRNFIVNFRRSGYKVTKISSKYEEVENGNMLVLFNQDGLMEIALNRDSAEQLLGIKLLDNIRIEFS